MDVEENNWNKRYSAIFSETLQTTVSTHNAVDNDDNTVINYDPKTAQYLQVLYGNDPKKDPNNNDCSQCENRSEDSLDVCQINVHQLTKLKDSTKKLICLLEEIQSNINTKTYPKQSDNQNLADYIKNCSTPNSPQIDAEVIDQDAINTLEDKAKRFDGTLIQDPEDDCSVYKRLTRKCVCLNHKEYNDFVIHFNEDSKFFTSCIGEIIKNLRIIKKFLYMGSDYTKNALMFLCEGLSESKYEERVDICQGCSHADMCNIFEEHSIVTLLISWPTKYNHYGDTISQGLAAAFLYQLAQVEEGRRYLKFNSKITNDIKKVLRTKVNKIEPDTLKSLNTTLGLMHPPITHSQHVNMSYYCKPINEGFGSNTLGALVQYRQYMTLDEVLTHLDLLQTLSNKYNGKEELISFLPAIIVLFRRMLVEYDNSEMNIVITSILNNIVSPRMVKPKLLQPKIKEMTNTATEPIIMESDSVEMLSKKTKRKIKSKIGTSNKARQPSLRKFTNWDPQQKADKSNILISGSGKYPKASRSPLIIIPIEH